jgi:type III restriction enzyme
LRSKLNQAEILVENWHTLMPLKEPDRSVVKKGKEPDEVFAKRVLGKLAQCKDIVVINDEAHHCYREKPQSEEETPIAAEEREEACPRNHPPPSWAYSSSQTE